MGITNCFLIKVIRNLLYLTSQCNPMLKVLISSTKRTSPSKSMFLSNLVFMLGPRKFLVETKHSKTNTNIRTKGPIPISNQRIPLSTPISEREIKANLNKDKINYSNSQSKAISQCPNTHVGLTKQAILTKIIHFRSKTGHINP